MSKLSTLNYLISSYHAGTKEIEVFPFHYTEINVNTDSFEFEPSQKSIDAILNFASQYNVLKSVKTGNIELNLN
jgi:acetolactate synthase small subunit